MKKIFFTILIFSLFLTNSGAKAGKALVRSGRTAGYRRRPGAGRPF